jgi:hypothetical protein
MPILSDRALAPLRELSVTEIRTWLAEHQPSTLEKRRGWYENVAVRALQRVYSGSDPDDRLRWAWLVVAAAEESVAQGADGPVRTTIRITTLAAYLAERGASFLDSNELVARCLSLIEVPFDRAAEQARALRQSPDEGFIRSALDELRRLRDAKNLLNAAVLHADRVTDPRLLNDLRRWQSIHDLLP